MLTVIKDAAKGGRLQAILLGWLAPVILGAYAFMIVVLPAVRDSGIARQVRDSVRILGVNKFLFVLVASLALAVLLYMNRTFLYRVLEGELWPRPLRRWRIERAQLPHYRYLVAKQEYARTERMVDAARSAMREVEEHPWSAAELESARTTLSNAEYWLAAAKKKLESARSQRRLRGRSRGRLPRRDRPLWTPSEHKRPDDPDWIPTYPAKERQVMATRVGNELKAMETYGANNYGLDSQTLWYELYSDAPEALRGTIDDRELQADTFVCAMYVTAAFLVAAVWAAIRTPQPGLWIAAAVSAVVLMVLHRGLLASITEWSAGVRALVNNGRLQLAERYGLAIPRSTDEEREMWQALTGFVYYGGEPHYAARLERFKAART